MSINENFNTSQDQNFKSYTYKKYRFMCMETKTLIIRSEIDGNPIRYNVKVSEEIVTNYAKVRKEKPEFSQPEALREARVQKAH